MPDFTEYDLETAIDQALEGGPRADDLEEMAARLSDRKQQILSGPGEPEAQRAQAADLGRKIEALLQEAAIARFVEQSVRTAARRQQAEAEFDDDPL